MTSRDYMPTDHDILQVSVPTAKVQEHKITLELGSKPGRVWCFYDFGGSRSQRAAWQPFFDDGTHDPTQCLMYALPTANLYFRV